MAMATKRAALAWFTARIGEMVDTKQVRPDGMVWEPGPREVVRVGPGAVLLEESTFRLTPNHVVLEVSDDRVVVELVDGDGVTIQWTTYRVDVHLDDEDDL